jgi:hypothetical protein
MFVITADQIDSRNDRDRANGLLEVLRGQFGNAFVLPPDQTSGDEVQMLLADARTALEVLLVIHRTGYWSIGLGIGPVRAPLAASTRQSAGEAFIAARDAVTRAKRADARFALTTGPSEAVDDDGSETFLDGASDAALTGDEIEALLSMLLLLRQRRTREGWEAADLLATGLSQAEVAAELGISTAAVSQRIKAALWRVEQAARPALVRLLNNLDRVTSEMEPAA